VAPCWKIDELAQRGKVTVDTIRYYAREKLLPPPVRSGRHKLYGPEHLDRLGWIRKLQAERFSLAAIRAVLDADRPGIEHLFTRGAGRELSVDDLVSESGVSRDTVDALRRVGLIPEPTEFGRESYDENDLEMLRAVAELQTVGMPERILIELGAIYVRHFRALQTDVHDMFAGKSGGDWDADELVAVQRTLTANTSRMIPATDQVLNYVHQRTIQRLALEAMRTSEETKTGIGGVRLDEE
jgi:DNA-binding transcriptional MerR regulator